VSEKNKILITGASGLLGKTLVNRFKSGGWLVLAQYFNNRGEDSMNCKWIYGDFSSKKKVDIFLNSNHSEFIDCCALINCYGPITYKKTRKLNSDDLVSDFYGNVIVANDIISYFLRSGNLKHVVNIGFESAGDIRSYKNILSYAIAKNALLLLTESYDKTYKYVTFSMISPPSLTGGKYKKVNGKSVAPEEIAKEIFEMLRDGGSDV